MIPDTPKMTNELAQHKTVEESTCIQWVNQSVWYVVFNKTREKKNLLALYIPMFLHKCLSM